MLTDECSAEKGDVLAITAYYDPVRDRFLIAIGVTSPPSGSPIALWIAEEGQSSRSGYETQALTIF